MKNDVGEVLIRFSKSVDVGDSILAKIKPLRKLLSYSQNRHSQMSIKS